METRRIGSFELSEFTFGCSMPVWKVTVRSGEWLKLETAVLSSPKGG
jgi:hypothetical protein